MIINYVNNKLAEIVKTKFKGSIEAGIKKGQLSRRTTGSSKRIEMNVFYCRVIDPSSKFSPVWTMIPACSKD